MHSYLKTILLAIFLFVFFSNFQSFAKDSKPFIVVIDAGHGGKDPGAIGGKIQEKDINLSVAKKLGNLLTCSGKNLKIVYTRNTDVFVDLSERTNISNKANADLFISIHSNASKNYQARGIETYVMGMEKSSENLQVAMRENSVITQEDDYSLKYEGYDPSSSESYIIFSLQQHSNQNESLKLATELQNRYSKYASTQMVDKGVKQANFLVLWKTAAPSILTEIGFISNQTDRSFISSEKGQNTIAKSLYEAVLSYIDSYNSLNLSTVDNTISSQPSLYQTKSPQIAVSQNITAKQNTAAKVVSQSNASQKSTSSLSDKVTSSATQKNVTTKTASSENSSQSERIVDSDVSSVEASSDKVDILKKVEIDENFHKLQYKVQIMARTIPISVTKENFFEWSTKVVCDYNGNIFKYFVIGTNVYEETLTLRDSLRGKFPDCFIVATYDGKAIKIDEARSIEAKMRK